MKGIVSLTAFAFHPQIAAVEIKLEPEWHIYWENPGDSGMETYLESDGQLLFPVPKKIQLDGGIINYGYEEKVTLFVQNPSADQIRLRWLVCKADTCVPGRASISIQHPQDTSEIEEEYRWLPPTAPDFVIDHDRSRTNVKIEGAVDFFPSIDLDTAVLSLEREAGSLWIQWKDKRPKRGGGLVVVGENRDRGYWVRF